MSTLVQERVQSARAGNNSTVICRMPSGWLVLADTQVLRGYCILLSDPVVSELNALPLEGRAIFLRDMSIVGDALLDVTGAALINYEILGNSDRALHAHIFPRYADEPEELRRGPAFFYDWDKAPAFDLELDRELMKQIAQAIQNRMGS